MPKINLCYIITKLELGGAQKQLLGLIGLLDKERFNVFLFTAKDGLLLREASDLNNLTIERSAYLERSINPFKDFFALIEIYRFIRKNNIDIVHTHSSKAGILGRIAARMACVKVIIHTVHGWSFNDHYPGLLNLFFTCLERVLAHFSSRLIVVSEHDKEKGLSCRIGKEDKYVVIRYGIDYAQFHAKAQGLRRALGIGIDELVVGTVSCLKHQKSPQDFIKLASLVNRDLPNTKFILAGDGILRPSVEKLVERFGLKSKIFLLGWRRDIPEILQALDVFVLTSLWEGLPISVLEAMAAAKPVIATNTGGVSEVIREGETGFLVAQRDMNEMSKKLGLLLKDGVLRKAIGENASSSLGYSFTLSAMVKKTQDLYSNLCS